MIFCAALSLVLLGLLFGFNIQVSDSIIELFASLGSILGGMGAACAAYISYRSIGQWRAEFNHTKLYELVFQLDDLLHNILDLINEVIFDEGISGVSLIVALPKAVAPYRKSYDRTYEEIKLLILKHNLDKNQVVLKELETLSLSNILVRMHEPFIKSRDSKGSIDYYFKKNPDDNRTIFNIPEVKKNMIEYRDSLNDLAEITQESRGSIAMLKTLL